MTVHKNADMLAQRPRVFGLDVDEKTRCAHYHTALDIIAIKLKCCGEYYACKECHDALADHAVQVWPRSAHDIHAILCGECSSELMISDYLRCGSRCPECDAAFNPRCSLHHHFYFAEDDVGRSPMEPLAPPRVQKKECPAQ